jgi:hypothetical protein
MYQVAPDKRDRAFWSLSLEFEDQLLTVESIPDEAFDFLIEIFSNKEIAGGKGLTHFITAIYTDFEKFSGLQKSKLLDLFVEHHEKYSDELTRHSVADLIARRYPNEMALDCFFELISKGTPEGKHIVRVGTDILCRRLDASNPLYAAATTLRLKAQDKK